MDIPLLRRAIRLKAEAAYSRSGGPGGQNVNKLNTRVTLRLSLKDLEGLSDEELSRLREQLGNRITYEDALLIHIQEERSQRTNLERGYARLEALIVASARLPKKRRPTKPSKAARERRRRAKELNSERKRSRSFSGGDPEG